MAISKTTEQDAVKVRVFLACLVALGITLGLWRFMSQVPMDYPALTRARDESSFLQWTRLLEEAQLLQLQQSLLGRYPSQSTVIRNARIIDMRDGQMGPPQDVRIANGRIVEIGDTLDVSGAQRVVEASGHVLMPGLVDMHVHGLESTAQPLLNIVHGVTAVREMDGFRWMLRQREQAANNRLFAPSMIVAGPILNASPMDWYAEVVTTEEQARTAVRAHAEAGYDAIKVHNNLPADLLTAIVDEAASRNIDVVGHIPHDVTVARAVELGFRTAEHFKGYLDDRTLTIADNNWREASRDSGMWNTPTLQAHRAHLRGSEAREAQLDPEAVQMSPLERELWRIEGEQPLDEVTRVRLGARAYADIIFRTLLEDGARFLTGTDSGGGYPFMIFGRVLVQEMQDFHSLGMSAAQTLRSATLEAAIASRMEGEFGEVIVGARADLILMPENPLENIDALLDPEIVCLRGACLDRAAIAGIRRELTDAYARTQLRLNTAAIMDADIDQWMVDMARLRADGVVFRDNQLASAESLLLKLSRIDDAQQVRGWMTDPDRWPLPDQRDSR
ncbi:amidohydrolase family protein [Dokdonella sp.]|uniref:amidohydrolase family protein n=1 Tax=Dokdonella sp. TaxID=2291710 RepID=UPI0035271010